MATNEIPLLEAIFHHLVLPPKLPRTFDGDNIALAQSLGERLRNALSMFRDVGDPKVWQTLEASLQATKSLNESPLYHGDIRMALEQVKESNGTVWLGVHVGQQNAALIVHYDHAAGNVIFEDFQTAAPVSDVLKTEHALTWDFPNKAIAIQLNDFSNDSFLKNLSQFLEQACSQAFDRFSARASKGGQSIVEIRDCPSPALISEILMSLFEGLGSPVRVCRLRKRVRDDIVLDASEIPWRRLPYWLVLRVTIGRILSTLLESSHKAAGRVYYKFIMCTVLAHLLKDCVGKLHPEMTLILQAKLCRRLAKLESEQMSTSGPLKAVYGDFFTVSSEHFRAVVHDARHRVTSSWEEYKKGIIRRIPTLPFRASKNDLVLDLRNSRSILLRLLSQNVNSSRRQVSVDLSSVKEGTAFQVNQLAEKYKKLVEFEAKVVDDKSLPSSSSEQRCTQLALSIERLINIVGDAYVDNSLLMSRHILRLFELWMRMDKEATAICPLIEAFHPVFVPSSLDVLCLQTIKEMERLSQVQRYIEMRINNHQTNHETIFGDPKKHSSFPSRFVYSAELGHKMVLRGDQIDAESQKLKSRKESELAGLTRRYDDLTQEIQSLECTCTWMADGTRNFHGCKKCYKWRCRKKLKITAHEDFLPLQSKGQKKAQRAALLLELDMPGYLAAYRAAVWKLHVLGSQRFPASKGEFQLLFKDLELLKKFHTTPTSITLASRKKSFLQTHYNKLKLPKKPVQVIFPFGAEFSYYDTSSNLWAEQLPKVPWFQHLLGSWLPRGIPDPYASADHVPLDTAYHPSSYEIMVNEPDCPPELSIHEFSALQRAVSGRARRWLVLLVELGTTNINYSSESSMKLLNRLVLQAGPAVLERGTLRESHSWFTDQAFCTRLFELLRGRLSGLSSSWREVCYMSILVTISLRLYNLCPQQFLSQAETLLFMIRSITSDWIIHLKNEVRSTSDGEVARKASTFAFWAALLSRQTFWASRNVGCALSDKDANHFFRASIALQENLLINLDQLDPALKRLLIEDLSNSYVRRDIVKEWFHTHHKLLESTINETWSDSGGLAVRSYSSWKMLSGSHEWWATSRIAGTEWTASQVVHYHLLQGHLFVDGKPLGKLPLQMRQDPAIIELFGGQHLLTRPSSLLEYQLVSEVEEHQVHFGFRDNHVVVRAFHRGCPLEYVPRAVFKGSDGGDLPTSLEDDCVHWLNLHTGHLEIRRKPWIWKNKLSNWTLNVKERVAIRNKTSGTRYRKASMGTQLVEPRSEIGQRITSIFRHFEDAGRLTIYQPVANGPLSVEMKRLEIRFSVNERGLLECPQLRAEVDPQQDGGTLYGLSSQVILRNVVNPERRSVLVPIGNIYWQRRGMHVDVRVANDGIYANFSIDKVLGRLDCAPEPLLLYLKAAIHALTSFPLPDGLTLRTGTEEARHCLLTARSQPWSPLKSMPQQMLSVIKSLSPKRWYYPPGVDLYQKVKWDQNLTASIQHEEFTHLVDSILLQSQQLEVFDGRPAMDLELNSQVAESDILYRRGRIRRQLYEHVSFPFDIEVLKCSQRTVLYDPSGGFGVSKESSRVYQTTCALRSDGSVIPQLTSLIPLMETWVNLGCFRETLLTIDIESLLDFEIPDSWGSFVQLCRRSGQMQSYDAYFLLALLAFDTNINQELIKWLVALYKSAVLRVLQPPQHLYFSNFRFSEEPSLDSVRSLVLAKQPLYDDFYQRGWMKRVRNKVKVTADLYEKTQAAESTKLASRIIDAWPHLPRSADDFERFTEDLVLEYVHLGKAWDVLEPGLRRLSDNRDLSAYIDHLDKTASRLYQQQSTGQKERQKKIWNMKPASFMNLPDSHFQAMYTVPRLEDLLKTSSYGESNSDLEQHTVLEVHEDTFASVADRNGDWQEIEPSKTLLPLPTNLSVLESIINRFSSSSETTIRKQYSDDLRMSLMALIRNRHISLSKPAQRTQAQDILYGASLALQAVHEHEGRIRGSLSLKVADFAWLSAGDLWPCLSRVALLEQLRDAVSAQLGPSMKAGLVKYGVLITKLQQLLRMNDATLCRDERRLRENQELEPHSNWNPLDHPEWLLLEIDNNLLIRPSQIDVARAIISPVSASNSVLQMNMGQGKTSCIMPMAVAVLADRNRLCRLVVPRSLLLQTAQVIQSRIGGLLGRVVRHVPFSRRSPMQLKSINLFQTLHKDIRDSGGVMLCLPEHIMSFKLSGLQQLADGQLLWAKRMIDIQRWLERSCRDVLDESDFTLSTKTQLIYPSGTPTTVDGHPQRWQVIEELLSLVEGHVTDLQSRFGGGIEIMRRHEGYPILHFLRVEVEKSLNSLLIDDVCAGRLPQVQFKIPADVNARRDVGSIVSGVNIDPPTWHRAADALTDDVFGLKNLYLLRGLISQNLLLTCLKKRWNVQYGLHPERAPIAVPFEAKGVPSPSAEYGHPDTALILTCLAFYQTGLTKSQVTQCLQLVLHSDDPSMQYERLVHGCNLPVRLEHWNLLTMDDEAQMEELWSCLRLNTNVVNYFLNNFAFPAHAKQFGVKLQASGWDIPILSNDAASGNLTTGFSGTNDNKRLLPQTIKQDDLPNLVQTNAEVLSYLLEPRNERCYHAVDNNGRHLTEKGLLELLRQQKINILIDAGAHILEMENHHLAAAWLDIYPDAQGAVYFDSSSRIMVRARFQKTPVPLLASPFADNLEKCVVYIDEAHTRGTDLKLPINSKGAVTLGLGQTKDQTVQAAMRLRQLGSTQSLAFVVPPEVYRNILDLRPSDNQYCSPVVSSDVVYWLLEQSCAANEKMMPLYTSQGFDFCRRTNALWKYPKFHQYPKERLQLLAAIQQCEDRTLEQLYGPRESVSIEAVIAELDFECLMVFAQNLCQQKLALSSGYSSAFEEVELEREVEFEFEQLREKQKPLKYTALTFPGLDPKIIHFVNTGYLEEGDNFIQGFDFIGKTKVGRELGVQKTSSRLFVTREFTKSIASTRFRDHYLMRPVEWVLWSAETETALVVIPEEAELAFPMLRDTTKNNVSLLTYAAPVSKSMWRFSALTYFMMPSREQDPSFPSWLPIEIGVLAGRLYFNYSEYPSLIAWLGIDRGIQLPAEHSYRTSQGAKPVARGLFVDQPLKFLLKWLTYRRQILDIMHTPMGYVCQNKTLDNKHPFFSSVAPSSNEDGARPVAQSKITATSKKVTKGNNDDDSDWEDGDDG
ncbi:hypothetical protein ACHAPU_007102 [Fusarium lateritium]